MLPYCANSTYCSPAKRPQISSGERRHRLLSLVLIATKEIRYLSLSELL